MYVLAIGAVQAKAYLAMHRACVNRTSFFGGRKGCLNLRLEHLLKRKDSEHEPVIFRPLLGDGLLIPYVQQHRIDLTCVCV
jgi:hypothetical protein